MGMGMDACNGLCLPRQYVRSPGSLELRDFATVLPECD